MTPAKAVDGGGAVYIVWPDGTGAGTAPHDIDALYARYRNLYG